MYKAVITYDGTRYFGWQKTISGPSIQQELETAIFRLTKEIVTPEAASRTDRGVHAVGQVIQFAIQKEFQPEKLLKALNAHLPTDIRIKKITPKQFHPTLDAIGKEYHYRLSTAPTQDPTLRLYSWHIHSELDLDKMNQESIQLIGNHDFSALANELETDPFCTLTRIECKPSHIIICGNRFLYKMVRNIVGALVFIGLGKLPPNSLPAILASKSRKHGAVTAPAHGLYLHQVFYPV